MSINFPLILVIGSFVTGIIWLVDSLFFAKSRKEDFAYKTESGREHDGETREYKEPFLIENYYSSKYCTSTPSGGSIRNVESG